MTAAYEANRVNREKHLKQLLIDAKNEILDLRRRNEILTAQVCVVEVFAAALGMKRGDGGACPDVAWALQKQIDEMEEEKVDAKS